MKKRLLLATNDTDVTDTLSSNLKKEFEHIMLVKDGISALENTLKEKPNILIVDTDLPLITGERLFHILKSNPKTKDIPFLFIGDMNAEIKGLRNGFDSLLIRPLNINEVCSRIKEVLSNTIFTNIIMEKNIEGKLSHLPLTDLIQILSLNKKEGILKVNHDGMEGRIYIKDGNVYQVTLENLEGEKAFFRMLTWKEGNFEFITQSVDETCQRIKIPTNKLLIEGLRQYDEWMKNIKYFPGKDETIKLKIDISQLPKGLKPIIYDILLMAEAYPSVGEIVDNSIYTDLEVYKALVLLIKRGVLEVVKRKEDQKVSNEILSSYQALKILERLFSLKGGEGEVGYGKILILSYEPSLIKIFINSCRGISGLMVKDDSPSSFSSRDYFGEIASLRVGESAEFIFFTFPPYDSFKPIYNLLSRNTIGIIFLWDEHTAHQADGHGELKNSLCSICNNVPVVNVFMNENPVDKEKEIEIRSSLKLEEGEHFCIYCLKEGHGMIFWIFYNLFGSFLRVRR